MHQCINRRRAIFINDHAIQAQLDSNPECLLKVLTLDNRNDKRLNTLITQFDRLGINTQQANKQQLDKLTKNQTTLTG